MSQAKLPHVPPVAFDWALNPLKLHQAEAYQKLNKLPTTEAAIKARYLAVKGKVAGGIPVPKKAVKSAKPKAPTKAKAAVKKPKAAK